MRAKNRVHENNIIDRFDTRYSEHLSYFKTCLDCSKAIMIIQLLYMFPLYTLYTKLPYITPIRPRRTCFGARAAHEWREFQQ